MAHISTLSYSLGVTVKIREYEYAKPTIAVEMQLEPTDNPDDVFNELTKTLKSNLNAEIKRLKKDL